MDFELAHYPVRSLSWGAKTEYREGELIVNREALRAELVTEPLIDDVELNIVAPGDRTRILHVVDIVEPRWKAPERGTPFPGSLGPLYQCGTGRTHALDGVAVVTSGSLPRSEEAIIDMCGPGSELSRFGRMPGLVVLPKAREGSDPGEFGLALMRAGLRAAVFLAQTTQGVAPARTEAFSLELGRGASPGLPRVGYLSFAYSHGIGRQKLFYGKSTRDIVPSVVHPNELLDGALVNDGYTKPTKNATHDILNHPMIRELHGRHNQDLVFAGMVLANHCATYDEKAATAWHAARLLRHVVEADAVVVTKDGGGQADVDLMLACRACEEAGLRTVLVAKEESGGDGPALVDVAPQADAMVSVGNCPEKVRLEESMDHVIGGDAFLGAIQGDVAGTVEIPVQNIIGAIDPIGGSTLTARPG
ncbi:MAG: hypothetical protein OXU75_16320 [Deltaproteobacteria bacterium]|nr:hypothetical protein [Deltaproteobacteria bacterium]